MIWQDYLGAALLATILIAPALMSGGRTEPSFFVYLALLFLFILIGWTADRQFLKDHYSLILVVFIAWAAIHSIFLSNNPSNSITELLPMVGGTVLFLSIRGKKFSYRQKVIFSILLLLGALIIVFFGLFILLPPGNSSYFRLFSTFYQHNALAGFMLVPLMLSLWAIHTRKKWGNIAAFFASAILFMGFVLTFSRGGMLAVLVALSVFIFFLYRYSKSTKDFFGKILLTFFVFGIAIGGVYWIFNIKKIQAGPAGTEISSPYQVERPGETGVTARLSYWSHALTLISEKPFLGFGLGTFGEEARRVQTDPRFYSTDPHNLYLRLFAELGFAGVGIFLLFIGFVMFSSTRRLLKERGDLLNAALLSGLVGLLIHNGGDVDFKFPADVYLFFATAALVLPRKEEKIKNKKLMIILLTIIVVVAFVSYSFIRSDSYLNEARKNIGKDEFVVIQSYTNSLRLNPLNENTLIFVSNYHIDKSELEEAKIILNRLLKFHPGNRRAVLMMADISLREGNVDEAELWYLRAIKLAPYKDLAPELALMNVYLSIGEEKKAREIAQSGVSKFRIEMLDSPIWINPNKEILKFQIILLEDLLSSSTLL